jgi:hypothetical protein
MVRPATPPVPPPPPGLADAIVAQLLRPILTGKEHPVTAASVSDATSSCAPGSCARTPAPTPSRSRPPDAPRHNELLPYTSAPMIDHMQLALLRHAVSDRYPDELPRATPARQTCFRSSA